MQWHERIGRRLKLRDLHILLSVMQHGSMAKAAVALAISQPAVSKAVADMEQTVGLRLLDRSRNGIEPTRYGRALARHGTTIFDELKQAAQELEFLADPTVGELRIGSQENMAAGLLPAVIDRFSRKYPRVRLTVKQTVFATAEHRELRERSVDLLLGRIFQPAKEDDLECETLFDDQPVIVSGSRTRLARTRRLALSNLVDEQWIVLPPDSLPGEWFAELFRAAGVPRPEGSLATLSIHLLLQLVATGRFIAVLPGSVLRFGGKHWPIKILPVKLPLRPRPVGIMRLKNRTLSPVAHAFIDCAKIVIKSG
jgi:DNA-binding transcriptional LysR family regulator